MPHSPGDSRSGLVAQVKVTALLPIVIQARIPTLLWGEPGVGKSSCMEGLGPALNLPVEVVIASIREPSDFAGLPIVGSSQTHNSADGNPPHTPAVHMAAPSWARRLADAGRGILFIDEISTAAPATQAALLRVVLDRVVGDLRLPESVAVLAAANPPEQAAGGWDLSPPLANRFCHLTWQLNAPDWCDGMLSGWRKPKVAQLPEHWRDSIPHTRSLVASFIYLRPDNLFRLPNESSLQGKAWPSPRTWDMAATLLAACMHVPDGDAYRMPLVAGCVGAGVAAEFFHWMDSLDLQDPEQLIADPSSLELSDRGDKVYATLSAVTAAILQNNSQERWSRGWKVLAQAVRKGRPDIAAGAARALALNRPQTNGQQRVVLPEEARVFVPLLQQAGLMK